METNSVLVVTSKPVTSPPPRSVDNRSESPPHVTKPQSKQSKPLQQSQGLIAKPVQKQPGTLPLCISNKAPIVPRESTKEKDKDKLPTIVKPTPRLKGVFRYKLLPGNNVRVVLSALRVRPWWHPLNKGDEDGPNAQMPSLIWEQYRNPKRYTSDSNCEGVLLNHLNGNNCLVSKKGLYFSLKAYCEKMNRNLLEIVPRTFYISLAPGATNDESSAFLEYNKQPLLLLKQSENKVDAVKSSNNINDRSNNEPCSETKSSLEGDELKFASSNPSDESNVENESEGNNAETKENPQSTPPPPPYSLEVKDSGIPKSQLSVDLSPLKNKAASRPSKPAEEGIVWILKPAALANRGYGIQVVRGVDQVMEVVNKVCSSRPVSADEGPSNNSAPINKYGDAEDESKEAKDAKKLESLTKVARRAGMKQGWIVQEYMERPLLVAGRKFDVRCFALLTHDLKKGLKAYFFKDAYVRTSSKKYTMNKLDDRETHLTNDAVQKYSKSYGKFENGNKLNFVEWQESINRDYPGSPSDVVEKKIFPAMKALTTFSICAAAEELNLKNDTIKNSFELLGYDYMFTEDFEPRLIEINSNPCLEFACPLLKELITNLINGVVRTAIDPVLKPPPAGSRTKACEEAIAAINEEEDRFECIFPPNA